MHANSARSIDATIERHGSEAIQRLVSLIRDAVGKEDDDQATALDTVLKHVERIVDVAQSGPGDRRG